MNVQIAEAVGQRPLLAGVDGLIPKEQHLMGQQGLLQLRELALIERPGQADVADLGADVGAEGVICRNCS